MNYQEAMESDSTVSPRAARMEIERHGASFEEFVAEAGAEEFYYTSEILAFLGY